MTAEVGAGPVRRLVVAELLLWLVGQVLGLVVTGNPGPILVAVWIVFLYRQVGGARDRRTLRAVQNRLTILWVAWILLVFLPLLAGRLRLPAEPWLNGLAAMLYGVAFVVHVAGRVINRRSDEADQPAD